MSDGLTELIIKKVRLLSLQEKKELLNRLEGSNGEGKLFSTKEEWREALLHTSVWTDDDIRGLEEAREYINKWNPERFF